MNFNSKPPNDHILQSGYFNSTLRHWQSTSTLVNESNFIYPLFLSDDKDCFTEIKSLPNVYRIGLNKLQSYLEPIVSNGLKCVLLFGVVDDDNLKDENGSYADNEKNAVIQGVLALKKWFPNLVIACDVCLCAYTINGHCGIFNTKTDNDIKQSNIDECINREISVERIAQVSLAFAKAGANIIAPSDMMDSRIHEIKEILKKNNMLNTVSVMSYSAKFASSFYGKILKKKTTFFELKVQLS
jgi:porphobilinogen synthase